MVSNLRSKIYPISCSVQSCIHDTVLFELLKKHGFKNCNEFLSDTQYACFRSLPGTFYMTEVKGLDAYYLGVCSDGALIACQRVSRIGILMLYCLFL